MTDDDIKPESPEVEAALLERLIEAGALEPPSPGPTIGAHMTDEMMHYRFAAEAHLATVRAEHPDETKWVPTLRWLSQAITEVEHTRKRHQQALAEIERLRAVPAPSDDHKAVVDALLAVRAKSDQMAEDEGLWFQAETCAEAYVQAELRKLCAIIESLTDVLETK